MSQPCIVSVFEGETCLNPTVPKGRMSQPCIVSVSEGETVSTVSTLVLFPFIVPLLFLSWPTRERLLNFVHILFTAPCVWTHSEVIAN